MSKRRSRGDGGIYWDDDRQRWRAEITVGYKPNGKRKTRKASGKTVTETKKKLRELLRALDEGSTEDQRYRVADAVNDWLEFGLSNRSKKTVEKYTYLANTHVIPGVGARKLAALSAEDVDEWLADRARHVSTRTLRDLHGILRRSINRAQARERVRRNVVLLCDVPEGKGGRPSKSLTSDQAEALLNASEATSMYAYITLALLTGARTEELRALRWEHVDLVGKPDNDPPIPPHIMVWRSVREGGDTKTRRSRRSVALPQRCIDALKRHQKRQEFARRLGKDEWQDNGLVFASAVGTQLDAANVRRAFRRVLKRAGLNPKEWTPRELRHSFVSLLSDNGVPLEQISRLVGHNGTTVTELVYRHQIRPVVQDGAAVMDRIFGGADVNGAA